MRKHTDDQLKFVGIVVKSEVKEHLYLCTHRVLYDVFIVISPRSKSATSLDREVLLAMLADVTTLSDDERAEPATLASSSVASLTQLEESVCRTQPSRKRKVTAEMQMMIDCEMRRSVRHVVSSNCRCFRKGKLTNKRNCFQPFRDISLVNQIFKLRKTLRTMHKADADQTAPYQQYQ